MMDVRKCILFNWVGLNLPNSSILYDLQAQHTAKKKKKVFKFYEQVPVQKDIQRIPEGIYTDRHTGNRLLKD